MIKPTILTLFWAVIPLQSDTAPPSSNPEKKQPAPTEEIAELVDALSSPQAHTRDNASTILMEMGPECYAPLRQAFNTTSFYEVRRRIRQIVLEIYLTEHLGPPRAFLGISHRGQSVTEGMDGRVPAGGTALYITDVFKASAAQRAGLQNGDLVVALNGAAGTLENQAIEFTRWIGEQSPGTKCDVTIIRGGQGIKLIEGGINKFTPAALEPVKFRAITHEQDPRVRQGGAAILLEAVRGVPIEIPVKEGDILVALDEEPIPEQGADDRFRKWISGEWRGRGTFLRNQDRQQFLPQMQPQGQEPQGKPSAQILRGGTGLDVPVVLGRWPTYLSDQSTGAVRAGNPGQREQVIETFGAWWRETFDPEQTFSERADNDADWQWNTR